MATTAGALELELRTAATRAAVDEAMERALEQLVATNSLVEAQRLSLGIARCVAKNERPMGLPAGIYLQKITQAASVCAEPADKAAFLGFELLSRALRSSADGERQRAEMLRSVYIANPSILPGFLAAADALDEPLALVGAVQDRQAAVSTTSALVSALNMVSPMLLTALTSAKEPAVTKLAWTELLSRLAWRNSNDSDHGDSGQIAVHIARILLTALRFHYPLSTYDATAYAAMAGTVVDLVTSLPPSLAAELAMAACDAILASIEHLHSHRMSVIQLLQTLERLIAAIPSAAWRSDALVWCAFFLISDTVGPIERRLVIKVLRHAIVHGKRSCSEAVGITARGVYVEALVLPLASMLSTEGAEVSRLLQDITSILALGVPFKEDRSRLTHTLGERIRDGNKGDIAAHAAAFLAFVGRSASGRAWLDAFPSDEWTGESDASSKPQVSAATGDKSATEYWTVLLLGSFLFDERDDLRDASARALDRRGSQRHSKHWSVSSTKLLVSGIVFLLSQKTLGTGGPGDWRATCLYVLASLAASANDTMKIVLRLVDSMKAVAGLRATALKLLYVVWERESRVYPRLETMIIEDEPSGDSDYHVVRMATLKALCARDPEVGVDFIAQIQTGLEDPLVSVAGMALDAIAALCRGDCLDFYAVFKIIALKIRKKKVACASDPQFQEKLCALYALGATSELEKNAKQADKLLSQLWELAETSESASVRCAAFASLNAFPLDALYLLTPADAGDDGEGVASDEGVEDNSALLLDVLAKEPDDATREQAQLLVTRVLEHESRLHTAGVGRGQMKSFSSLDPEQQLQSVSAVATKDLRKRLPAREEVIGRLRPSADGVDSSLDSLVGFLLAFRPPVDEAGTLEAQRKSGKRKDRLVRVAAQDVEACEGALRAVLPHMGEVLPWSHGNADGASAPSVLLSVLALLEAWQAFMATYVSCLEEFANLKVPASAEEGAACAFYLDLVKAQVEQLLRTNGEAGVVAAGALLGQLCEASNARFGCRRYWTEASVREYLLETLTTQCRSLLQTFEQHKVFGSAAHGSALVAAILGVQLALVNVLPARRTLVVTGETTSEREWLGALSRLLAAPMEKVLMPLSGDEAVPEILRAVSVLGVSSVGCVLSKCGAVEFAKPAVRFVLATALGSVAVDAPTAATDAVFAAPSDREASERAVVQVVRAIDDASESRKCFEPSREALQWASFVGLAQLAAHFGALKALDWLGNTQAVLMALWESAASWPSSPMAIAGIALSPVLLESIRFGITSSSALDAFVLACENRMKAVSMTVPPSEQLVATSGFLIVPYVLSRADAYAGSAWIHARLATFLDCCCSTLARSRQGEARGVAQDLALVGIANCFGHSAGVMLVDSSAPTPRFHTSDSSRLGDEPSVEMPFDADAVSRIVQTLLSEAQENGRALAVLGTVARQASRLHVSQRKKALDVEMRTLPATGLLLQSLELLRQASLPPPSALTNPSDASERLRQVNALLSCLAAAGPSLPLMDYSELMTRLMARVISIETSTRCIRLASTQGSCDSLLMIDLAASTLFPVMPLALQIETLASLPRVAGRVPLSVFGDCLDAVSTAAFEAHEARDEVTDTGTAGLLFTAWIDALSALVSPSPLILDEVRELVTEKILGDYLDRLPLAPADHELARSLASRVLAPLERRDRIVDALLQRQTPRRSDRWAWWRAGALITELVRSAGDTGRLSRRELALLLQWLLGHDFEEWVDSRQELKRVMAVVAELVAANTRHQDESAVSALLDAVDGYARSLAAYHLSSGSSALTKASALFELVARVCCLSWRECQPFERSLVLDSADSASPALELLPTALLRCGGASKRWLPLYEQLWAVAKRQRASPAAGSDELTAHTVVLELCFLRARGADSSELLGKLKPDVDGWWSFMSLL